MVHSHPVRALYPQSLLRVGFYTLGFFIVIRGDLVLKSGQALAPSALTLFPNNAWSRVIVVIATTLLPMQGGVLALITGLAMSRGWRWARWTGFAACLCLLPGLPWFTLIGVVGSVLVLGIPVTKPSQNISSVPAQVVQDYWIAARNSRAQQVILFASGALLIAGLDASSWLASRIGLPAWNMDWVWWLWLFVIALGNTAIHEFGHACMAWALYQEIKSLSVGPVTAIKGRHGRSVQIQWARLLETGGYMGSVPTSLAHLRLQEIAVILAGPAASLFMAMFTLAVFLSLPGTAWESHWELIAINGIVAFDYVLLSAIPVGYSDGSMLFHLLAKTKPGQLLIDNYRAAHAENEANALLDAANLDSLTELRRSLLQNAVNSGPGNSLAVAHCYQQLGYAQAIYGDWPAAEASMRKCLEFGAECNATPAIAANAWTYLHYACVARHHVPEASLVYPSAVQWLAKLRQGRDRISFSVNRAMVAELNQRAGRWAETYAAACEGVTILPRGNERLALRILLLSAKAYSETILGKLADGLSSAEEAVLTARSGRIPSGRRNYAWSRIGELGFKLWKAGEDQFSVRMIREAIDNLENAGAHEAAVRQRISLACIFRSTGDFEQAFHLLPPSENLPPITLRLFLEENARLHLSTGRLADATALCQQLLEIWRTEPGTDPELAVAGSLYARVCFENNDFESSIRLARSALAVLDPWEHIEAVPCRTTLFLLESKTSTEHAPKLISDSIEQIANDPLLTVSEKSRLYKAEAFALEKTGFKQESQKFVEAAQGYSKGTPRATGLSAVARA
jgi:tetratricopeptide (TPR) repeat protein